MTDHSHSHSPQAEVNPFTSADVKRFAEDDSEAGRAIGKMLSIFFLYTVVVMTASAVATWWWINHVTIS